MYLLEKQRNKARRVLYGNNDNGSSGSSKCLVTLLAMEVVILVDVWYVVVTGALKPNTLGEF